jgi:hypothetical protein
MPEVSILDLPNVLRGTRATRTTSFPVFENGEESDRPCLLVPLTGTEEADALSFAVKYARDKGAAELKAGDPLFDLGFMAKTLTLGVRTPEGGPMFASPASLLDALPRETMLYVWALLEDWQDACSPSVRKVTDEQLWVGAAALATGGSEGERFFDRLSPGMRRTYTLFLASQLFASPGRRSPSSSPVTATTTPSLKPLARTKERRKRP